MLIYRKETPYFAITLDLGRNELKILQRWKYSWAIAPGSGKWTYAETKNFHHKVDRLIWSVWGSRFELKLAQGSKIPANYKVGPVKTYFDVKWVLDNSAHWKVTVTKIKRGAFQQSYIRWNTREISLDTEDTTKTLKYINGPVRSYQYGLTHEFGHTLGNVAYTPSGHGDEYASGSPYLADFPSIMNSGNELRQRHLDFIKQTLNSMVPGVKFDISHVR